MIILPKKEYGEVCHAIQTKYGNKIPKRGTMLYSKNFYVYTYDEYSHKIEYELSLPIEGNQRIIQGFIMEVENADQT